ncbi:MAG: hypothetical protein KU37_05250 [Sulfuricurvum sp. PC08-66]|nr:MAG: hypothetical protein KU37_05250 [Sulfuricurvum sp. PC08-66]
MKMVIFYEKPGCATNTRQKALLRSAGCMILERNLLDHGMNRDELYSYLHDLSVSQWFNPNAPAITQGLIDPHAFSTSQALDALMREPILIRRPLMLIAGQKMCGFDQLKIEALLGQRLDARIDESCSSTSDHCA